MAAPTTAACVKKLLPTRSRPHMARLGRLGRCSKSPAIWGYSGRDANIVLKAARDSERSSACNQNQEVTALSRNSPQKFAAYVLAGFLLLDHLTGRNEQRQNGDRRCTPV